MFAALVARDKVRTPWLLCGGGSSDYAVTALCSPLLYLGAHVYDEQCLIVTLTSSKIKNFVQ